MAPKYKKKRGRRPLKKITSGGSYPFYQGRMGGGGPYFILKDRDRDPELQLPPTMLKWFEDQTNKVDAASGLLSSTTGLVTTSLALGGAATEGARRAYEWYDPKEAAKSAQTAANQAQTGKDEANRQYYTDIGQKLLGANTTTPNYEYSTDRKGRTWAKREGSRGSKTVKSIEDHRVQLAANKQRSDTVYAFAGYVATNYAPSMIKNFARAGWEYFTGGNQPQLAI